ncbi:MAG: hypothetical protein AABZ31_09830 [Bdellovibrionota bacterium]
MKSILSALIILGLSSTSFANVTELITCESKDKKIELWIGAKNRPDFELSKFDSSAAKNSDEYGVAHLLTKNSEIAKDGQVKILFASEGETTRITEQDDAGRTCVNGTQTKKIKVKAQIAVQGRLKVVKLICEDNFLLDSYSVECE